MKWILAGGWLVTLAMAAAVGHHLAARDPARAQPPGVVESRLSDALRERDVLTRAREFAAAVEQLDEGNIDASLATFEAQRVGVTAFEVRLFMFAWSRFDPAGAFAWATAWQGRWRGTLENAAIYSWGFRDPEGAVRALKAVDSTRHEELRASLVNGWARSGDTAGLTEYLFSKPASRERSRFIGLLLAELIQHEHGPAEVRAWAEGIPEDGPNRAKVTAFLTAGGSLAQNDPKNAVAFFRAHQSYAYAQPALRTIARRWADHHDPRDLFAWLEKLPPSEARNEAVDAGFSRWLSNRPDAARTWLRESERSEALDPAVAVFARETARASAPRAVEWADGIHDPILRRRLLTTILRQWVAEDRKAARAWMRTHSVPVEVQREFLNPS